jgi:putative FmdB family regulatory protein
MPTYIYRCQDCERELQVQQKMSDNPLRICPTCGGVLRRLIQPVNWIPRCSGFYRTDKVLSEKKSDD